MCNEIYRCISYLCLQWGRNYLYPVSLGESSCDAVDQDLVSALASFLPHFVSAPFLP